MTRRHLQPLRLLLFATATMLPLSAQTAVADGALLRPRERLDLRYSEASRDPRRNMLDLYLPAGTDPAPVVVFVHGGSWMGGSKEGHALVGRFLAEHGFAAAVIDYRLHPFARWPAFAEDCAAACAFLRANAGELGVDSNHLFLVGHSAGAQIAGLVACDRRWLDAAGAGDLVVRGFVGLSGIYDLRPRVQLLTNVFGSDLAARANASPIVRADARAPPSLLVWADHDLRGLDLSARMLAARLRALAVPVECRELRGQGHAGYVFRIGGSDDAIGPQLLQFLCAGCQANDRPPANAARPHEVRRVEHDLGDAVPGLGVVLLLPVSTQPTSKAPVLVVATAAADDPRHLQGAASVWAARGLAVALVPCSTAPAQRPADAGRVAATCAWLVRRDAVPGVDPQRLFLGGIGGAGAVSLLAAFEPRWLGEHGLGRTAVRGVVAIAARCDPANGADSPLEWIRRDELAVLQIDGGADDAAARDLRRALEQAGSVTIPVPNLDAATCLAEVGTERDKVTALLLGFAGIVE
jgi:acetyl esterase/lipase